MSRLYLLNEEDARILRQLRTKLARTSGTGVSNFPDALSIISSARRVLAPPPGGGSTISQFRVFSVQEDHLVCRTWDGSTEGVDDINIAKPYLLRRTPFDGQLVNGKTYTYTSNTERNVDDGANNEDQLIIPRYTDPSQPTIYAATSLALPIDVEVGGLKLIWVDINADGRAWARKFEEP
jgi:hypothetical protein